MATIELIELLVSGSAGDPPLGATIACLLVAAASLGVSGTSGVADRGGPVPAFDERDVGDGATRVGQE